MAQDIEIANAQYNDVPSIEVPKQGGGTAEFVDTSDADAIASEIDMGKTAYVNGVKLTGTRSGGGSYTAGDGIDITNDVISLKTASANDIGGIKVGSGLSIDGNGVLSATGGGGGGSSYTETVLFSNASGVNSGTINLSGNISDYDLIDIQCVNKLNGDQSTNMRPSNIFASSQLLENLQNGNFIGIWGATRSGVSDALKFKIASDSSIYFDSPACVNLAVTKVVGIKYGRYVSGVAVDTTVTQGSSNVVTSGAVYSYIASLEARIQALESRL